MPEKDDTKTLDPADPGTTASADRAASRRGATADQLQYAFPIPAAFKGKAGVDLLMEACTLYGIDPDPEKFPGDRRAPRELADWKYYPKNRLASVDRPDIADERVVLVTSGGLKLSHPADADTLERLQKVFRLITVRKNAKGDEETLIRPLPDSLTLPTVHVTGLAETSDHQYAGGYLRDGGKTEATRRAQLRDKAGLAGK